MSPGVYQNNPKYVPDANILKDPCTATYTLGWKRWAGAGNAPPPPPPPVISLSAPEQAAAWVPPPFYT